MNKKYKDILSIVTCGLSFLFGWGLTIAGFIVPPTGEVSGTNTSDNYTIPKYSNTILVNTGNWSIIYEKR